MRMPDVQREPWMVHGACLGLNPDIFFPERGQSSKVAKDACAICPVRTSCLEYAFRTNQRWGVWGGLSERQRRVIRRRANRHDVAS